MSALGLYHVPGSEPSETTTKLYNADIYVKTLIFYIYTYVQ